MGVIGDGGVLINSLTLIFNCFIINTKKPELSKNSILPLIRGGFFMHMIIDLLPNETIQELNTHFAMHLKKHIPESTISTPPFHETEKMKRLMEEDDEVNYNRNTY